MRKFLQSLLPLCIIPAVMVGCASSPQHTTTGKTSPSGKRIFIPQERVIIERVREYEKFLARHDVAGIVPSFELLRSARDWQKCGSSEYAVPNRELWNNSLSTLRVFKYLIAAKVLTDFEVTSVYRDLPLNQCAGGASSSKHLFNSAIDFRIGPEVPQPQDYAFIENTKFKLCQFWAQHGQSLNLGIGLYSSGQIHIDTQGYRTWGPDLTRNTSMCNF